MADSAKKEKIAAARKKLKQFQKTGKGGKRDSSNPPKPKVQKQSNGDSVITNISSDIGDTAHIENSVNRPAVVNSENRTEHQPQVAQIPAVDSVSEKGDQNKEKVDSNLSTNCTSSASGQYGGVSNTESTSQVPQQTFSQEEPYQRRRGYINMASRPSASTESLQQLSRQINGILAESPVGFEAEQSHSDILELETRNRELAALLAQHSQTNEQLVSQNDQIRQHALNLQSQLEQERSTASQRITKEIGPIKEQLQVHIQTIGILVAEKTELQSQLSQSNKISEQRFGEIEDLSGRLKTSKQRVGDLERTLSTSNTSTQKLEETGKESAKEVDRLNLDLFKLKKSHEELKQTSSEIQEKLKSKTSESCGLQSNVEDLKRRLEMAELYNQQLTNQNEAGQEHLLVLGQLQQERESLSTQLQQHQESLQKVTSERDQLAEQYQQYMQQLQNQNTQLTGQISSLTEEREKMVTQNYELEAAVLELQRKLEDIDSERPAVDETAHSELVQEVNKLQSEYTDLSQRHEAQIRDNSQLSRYLEERETQIGELETRLEELGEMAGDKAELLENIQSDKTALSRALTQNKDLKVQLAELQNGFVKLSNDNMEMMTVLQTEQHSNRDHQLKLLQQEEEFKQVREQMSERERELEQAQLNSVEANKVNLLHDQIQDRLRHYEAQAQLVETLQKELHSSQDMVDALTTQNSELRTMLIRATETKSLNPDAQVQNAQREDVIDSLQATIQQLESERNQLLKNLREQRDVSDHLSVRVSDLAEEVVQTNASGGDNDKVPKQEYAKVKYALDMIQDKYNHVMRDKADLSDKADELEHLVLQLQGETDTIGEYISLYHHQRALLQQREIQKNEYISQLAKDREELQDKLGELQALVMQLMGEKHMLNSYTEETLRPVSPNIHPPINHAHRKVNGEQDWPDYTSSEDDSESEVETIVGGKDDVTPHPSPQQSVIDNTPPTHKHNHAHNNAQLDNQLTQHRDSHSTQGEVEEKQTAHRILNLLSEIGNSNLVDSSSFMEKQFHPCKYCKGRLQIL